jgi:hypothetical protein
MLMTDPKTGGILFYIYNGVEVAVILLITYHMVFKGGYRLNDLHQERSEP